MSLIKVKDYDGFYKDTSSGAIVNKNKSDYEKYIENRKRLTSEKERLNSIENNVDELKNDINDIKSLLLKVLESNGQ